MAKKNNREEEVLVDVTQSISKVEQFFEENSRSIIIVVVAIFAISIGYITYDKYVVEPNEIAAQEEIYQAQHWFEVDSFEAAVNGLGDNLGFLDIAADYSGTAAGNLANYYAGMSYLRMGEFENAIKILDEYHTDDPVLAVNAKAAIGDAFMELNQAEDALEYYQKAISLNDNEFAVPFVLLKAGLTAESLGKNAEALEFYEQIKNDYPDSRQALDIDRYIGRMQAQL